MLDKNCELILNTPNCYTFILGDMMENATKTSVGNAMFDEAYHMPDQLLILQHKLEPLAAQGKILGIVPGNHELRTERLTGSSSMKTLAYQLNVPYCGYQGYLKLKVQEQTYRALMFHGTGSGTTIGGKVNAAQRLGNVAIADLYCFLPEQKILTDNCESKRIDDKNIKGVITHLGTTKNISQHTSRKYDGLIYNISVSKLPNNTISCTDNHEIFAIKRKDLLCHLPSRQKDDVVCRPQSLFSYPCDSCKNITNAEPKWIMAENLEPGDFVVASYNKNIKETKSIDLLHLFEGASVDNEDFGIIPIDGNKRSYKFPASIAIDYDFMRLCGYWLAEGSIAKQSREDKQISGIRFAFHDNENDFRKDICDIISKYGLEAKEYKHKESQVTELLVHSKWLGILLYDLFGNGSANKSIPKWMIELPHDLQFELLKGLLRGDGHCRKDNKFRTRRTISYGTISESLAWQVWNIFMRLGYVASIKLASEAKTVEINGKLSNKAPAWDVSISGNKIIELAKDIFGMDLEPGKTNKSCHIELGDFILFEIEDIKKVDYRGEVCCLSVPGENSFSANGVAVHNCVGHSHVRHFHEDQIYSISDDGQLQSNRRVFVTCGSMLEYWNSYAEQSGFLPNVPGTILIELRGDIKQINVIL